MRVLHRIGPDEPVPIEPGKDLEPGTTGYRVLDLSAPEIEALR